MSAVSGPPVAPSPDLRQVRATLAALEPVLAKMAAASDRLGGFPSQEMRLLAKHGILSSVLPATASGPGFGTEPDGAEGAFEILRSLGRANVALARLFEGHLNAIKLVAAFGTPLQLQDIAADVQAGHIFAIWNTEAPPGLQLEPAGDGFVLSGAKLFASGVGHVDRAVVTARLPGGDLVLAALAFDPAAVPFSHAGWDVLGVKGAATGRIDLAGLHVARSQIIGKPGDYFREPDFSAGAWRTLCVQTGAMEALYDLFRAALLAASHGSSPIQRARLAEIACHCETARLWSEKAGVEAETGRLGNARAIAYVNLARATVGHSATRTIELVQRGIGAKAFVAGHPVERIARDLSFYLRQPAPDQTVDEAAATLLAASCTIAALWTRDIRAT